MKNLLFTFCVLLLEISLVSSKGISLRLERVGAKSRGTDSRHPTKKCGPLSIFSKALGLCVKQKRLSHKLSINNQLQNNTFMKFHQASVFTPNDLGYQTPISLGDPLKTLRVVVDTGGTALWVPGKGCSLFENSKKKHHSDCDNDSKVYSSATGIQAEPVFSTGYVQGSVSGTFAEDHFAFGDASNPTMLPNKVKFGVASEIYDTAVVGNLGLSLRALKESSHVFHQLRNHYLATHPDKSFSQAFTIWLTYASGQQDEGVMTIGAHDLNDCDAIEAKNQFPISDEYKNEWYIEMDKVQFGKKVPKDEMPIRRVLMDTGSSWIRVTPNWYEIIKEVLEATEDSNGFLTTTKFKGDEQEPKLLIKFKGSDQEFGIPPSNFLLPGENGKRFVLIKKLANNDESWTLGAPWFRSFCTTFDWDAKKVGVSNML